jgi:hypothetical protein
MRRMTALRRSAPFLVFGLALLPLAASSAQGQGAVDKQKILAQARQSYYNLRAEGMSGFQCDVTPNWELMLAKERKENPSSTNAAIKTLSQLRFTTSLAADSSVKVTHNDLAGQSEEMMKALAQIYGGMEQMASGFFETWNVFMLSPPFPEVRSEYRLESAGPGYRLTYKEGTADVVTTMGRDFAISEMQITTPESNSVIHPTFARTAKGLRLSGYEPSYESQKPDEATQLRVLVDYQDLQGLSMLQKLNLSGSYGGSPFAIELTFSGCQVTKKQTSASR